MKRFTSKTKATLITLGLVFCFNPYINIIDILPDFVFLFFFATLINDKAEAVPYFYETKSSLLKLGFLSLARIPASLIMFANMTSGNDIVPLFTLVFAIAEILLGVGLINNLFNALFYLGQRTETPGIIEPFTAFGRKMRPEVLKAFSIGFIVTRSVIALIPEFCLLTYSDAKLKHALINAYPLLILLSFLLTLCIGAVWLALVIKYKKSVTNNSLQEKIESLLGENELKELEEKKSLKKKMSALSALGIGSVFMFELSFEETMGVDVLPHFIYGLFILYVVFSLFNSRETKTYASIACATLASFGSLGQLLLARFVKEYSYADLEKVKEAKSAYALITAFSVIEWLSLLLLTFVVAREFVNFAKQNTALSPEDENYSKTDAVYHKKLTGKIAVLFIAPAVIGFIKMLNVVLMWDTDIVFTENASIIETSPLPWLGVVTFILTCVYVFYSMTFTSSLKEDIRMKYSEVGYGYNKE